MINKYKKSILVSIALLATACSPAHMAANKNGIGEYVWVGCHVITKIPNEGSYAFYPLDELLEGNIFYFKQASLDGSVGPVLVGEPCKE
mgnify:CR=1 FL=1|jgi:hypothetical protein|tara:strand:+ start:748 stop:1014 length:267 start_codon:yes stop_codon:yes gene_type:complete